MKLLQPHDHHPMIAQRMQDIPKSATLAINEKSKYLKQQGQDVISLGLGQSPFPVPECMTRALREYSGAKDYMAVQGYLPLREAIAGFIQRTERVDCSADNIIIGPGSKELFFDLQLVLDAELLLPAPSWVSYDPQARLLGKPVHWLQTRKENGWKLTAEELEEHCRQHPQRQLLILNSPNNPSGACLKPEEMQSLARVAEKYGVIILSDEIYSELHYQEQHKSMANYYPQGTIISNGISKWAGAGGWRLGYMMIPEQLRMVLDVMVVVASETFTSVSAPIQMASIVAFEDSSEMKQYIAACRRIMRSIGLNFSTQLNQHSIDVVDPDGGFYCLGEFNQFCEKLLQHGITSSTDLSQAMLDNVNIAALPGTDFGMRQGLSMRFAFVDFDGEKLLHQALADSSLQITPQHPQLNHIFEAADRMGNWLNSL